MIVLIDAGNTLVKFGWLDPRTGQRETSPMALSHHDLSALHDLGPLNDWLNQLAGAPTSAIGINVARPGLTPLLDALLWRHACKIRWVTSLEATPGLHNGYNPPDQLGADRWVALAGLSRHVSHDTRVPGDQPLMLATFGTATTIDTLAPETRTADKTVATMPTHMNADIATQRNGGNSKTSRSSRAFCGGLIFPGPAMMRSTLAVGTAQLSDADGTVTAYPTHTRQAIATGIAAAQAGAVVRQWLAGLDGFGRAPRVYCAGGGWAIVEHEVRRLLGRAQRQAGADELPIERLSTPVLNGLASLAQSQEPAQK